MPNILIIEDDATEKQLMKETLEKQGDTVKTVNLSIDGIETYLEYGPDVVIMDFDQDTNLSKQIANRMTEMDSTACIFAIVGDNQKMEEISSYTAGVRATIPRNKPIKSDNDAEELVDRIVKACSELSDGYCSSCWKVQRYEKVL